MSPANAPHPEDLELFLKLESLYHALKLSVQDPIVVPNPQVKPGMVVSAGGSPFGKEGKEIVRRRIEKNSEDIRKAYAKHKEMSVIFNCIDVNAADGKRFYVAGNILQLCNCLLDYRNFIINDHQKDWEKEHFLHLPHYLGGNISCRRDISSAFLKPFNPQGSDTDFRSSIEGISSLLTPFRTKAESNPELNLNCVYTGNEQDSYDACLHLTKMLLKEHFDFDMEGKYFVN